MMDGKLIIKYNDDSSVKTFHNDMVKIKTISRHVVGSKMEIKYIFTSTNYTNIYDLVNFVAERRPREINFYVDNHLMNTINTKTEHIFIQEFNNGVDYTTEISWFVEV